MNEEKPTFYQFVIRIEHEAGDESKVFKDKVWLTNEEFYQIINHFKDKEELRYKAEE